MNLQHMIDRLGTLKAKRELIEKEERMLKAALIANGVGIHEGEQFIAEVQHYERVTISPHLVRTVCDDDTIARVTESKFVDAVVVKARPQC